MAWLTLAAAPAGVSHQPALESFHAPRPSPTARSGAAPTKASNERFHSASEPPLYVDMSCMRSTAGASVANSRRTGLHVATSTVSRMPCGLSTARTAASHLANVAASAAVPMSPGPPLQSLACGSRSMFQPL
eukprot:5605485-Prymnesium_polylepis.1